MVTPLVGVWIEIKYKQAYIRAFESLPLWECGLKFLKNTQLQSGQDVTPLVGVWIEIGV